ncbi:MAG TPA: hypothetical protein VMZ02_00315 [Candidatus Limnocylindrales bacterium]|nr:hypothetical protein [Candidatus Limnocylindrales bacterium]
MTSRQLPKQQKAIAAERNRSPGRRTSPVGRIAHELINQLSVLNLVAYNVIAGDDCGQDARLTRNKEIFQQSVHQATALAEQLARYVDGSLEGSEPIPESGKVVRLLRSMARCDR